MTDSDLAAAIASRDALAEQVEAVRRELARLQGMLPGQSSVFAGLRFVGLNWVDDQVRSALAILEAK